MSSSLHKPVVRTAEFRFYAELNDFLPDERRQRAFLGGFHGTPTVKNAVEAMGVPHTEIDLILVDGESVEFSHRLAGHERVAVYPVFERFDISPLLRLRPRPLRVVRFVADVHLGRLSRYLRMIGFDTVYDRDFSDEDIIRIAQDERRIILTRDRGLLRNRSVSHGYMIRDSSPRRQLWEVADQFHLRQQLHPFSRCMCCNGCIEPAVKSDLEGEVDEEVLKTFTSFSRCSSCGRIYWEGSHFKRMTRLVDDLQRPGSSNRETSGRDPVR